MRMGDLNDPFGFGKRNLTQFELIDWDVVQQMLERQLTDSNKELLKRYFPGSVPGGGAGSSSTASSTSGAVSVKPVPAATESWWVKVPDQPRLELVRITSISEASVSVQVEGSTVGGLRHGRYERSYLKFVEKYVHPSLEPKSV
jgi:hypothetical protein